jgi:hypothetical protein
VRYDGALFDSVVLSTARRPAVHTTLAATDQVVEIAGRFEVS